MTTEPMKITKLDYFGEPANFLDIPVKETLAQRRRREITEAKNKPKPAPKHDREGYCERHGTAFLPSDGCYFCRVGAPEVHSKNVIQIFAGDAQL
jgi:hypothetical protein